MKTNLMKPELCQVTLRLTLLLIVLGIGLARSAEAQILQFDPVTSFLTVGEGGSISYIATLTNTSSTIDIDVNSIQINLENAAQPYITVDTNPFFNNVPAVLYSVSSPNPSSTGQVSLFDLGISPFTPVGTYNGTVQIFGRTDGATTPDVQLATSNFQVNITPAPEAGSLILIGTALCGAFPFLVLRHRK